MSNNGMSQGGVLAAVSGTSPTINNIPSSSRTASTPPPLFPFKLHFVLEEAARNGQEDIVSWMPFGTSFKVHNKEEFERQILPTYFNTTKFKSFQRSLNLWGFHAFTKGPSKGASHHPLFRRGRPELCKGMTRERIKRTSSITTEQTTTDPAVISQMMMMQQGQTALLPSPPSPSSLPRLLPPYLPLTEGQLGSSSQNKYKMTSDKNNKNTFLLPPRHMSSSNLLPLANFYVANAPSLSAGTIRNMIAGGSSGGSSSPHRFVLADPNPTTTGCLGSGGLLESHHRRTFHQAAARTLLIQELLRGTTLPTTTTTTATTGGVGSVAGLPAVIINDASVANTRLAAEKEQQARQLLAFAASAIDKAANISRLS